MISMHETFTDAIGGLPKDIKARVLETFNKFDKDSSLSGLNLEKIEAKDLDVYSIRVNDDYRIICKIYGQKKAVFLYVGKHDDAYNWAKTHSATIDAAGILSVTKAAPSVRTEKRGKRVSRLDVLSNQEMAELDISPNLWSILRERVFFTSNLVAYKQFFSEETYMVLEEILNGNDKNDALDFYRDLKSEPIVPIVPTDHLFDISFEDLGKIGVPSDKINLVSAICSKEQFKSIQKMLPSNAVEALYKYIDGIPLSEIKSAILKKNKPADEENIDVVLNNPGTKQHVVTVDNQEELERLFNMPMEKWRVYLHPDQRQIVEAVYNGPARVIGGAGTGKTVVVIHRARMLAKRCSGNEHILVTTFSKTLADDIISRLRLICTTDEMKRIYIGTFDSVTKDYLQLCSPRQIKYDEGENSPIRQAWAHACAAANYHDFDIDFYLAEWRDVFQGQKVNSKEEYLTKPRKGKGNRRLNKTARERVFQVITEYQNFMVKKKWIDIDWAQNLCAERIPTIPGIQLYKHILVDECQDFTSAAFRLLRALAGQEHSDDLFLAGDSRQRIYNGHSSLSSCGIIVNNRSYQIKINYRTTREIYDLSLKIQRGYNYDNLDDSPIEKDESVPTKHGEIPTIQGFSSWKKEQDAVIANVKKRISEGCIPSEICIVAKEKRIAYRLAKALNNNGIDSLYLANNQSDDKSIAGVRTATMHRVKGMEYDCIYVISANNDLLPNKKEYDNPDNEETDLIRIRKKEANLLSVAVTRARKNVWVSYYGEPTILLNNVLKS